MRIIHGDGYSTDDRKHFRVLVYRNILTSLQALIGAMELLKTPFNSPDAEKCSREIMVVEDFETFSEAQVRAIVTVWSDTGIQTCYQRRREFQLSDSTK